MAMGQRLIRTQVPDDNVQVKTRPPGAFARPSKRLAEGLLERSGCNVSGSPGCNKRPANNLSVRTSMAGRDKESVLGSSTGMSGFPGRSNCRQRTVTSPEQADSDRHVSLVDPSATVKSQSSKPTPPSTTSRHRASQAATPKSPLTSPRPQAATPYPAPTASKTQAVNPNAPTMTAESPAGTPQRLPTSVASGSQAGTPDAPTITSRPQASAPNPLSNVRVFLEVQRPTGPPKNCWSIPVEEMDIFTGERVRTRLLRFKLLRENEKILMAHIRPNDDGDSVQGVETSFVMPWDCPEQPDWEQMLEGLKAFYSSHPPALGLKLRATLEVGDEEVQSVMGRCRSQEL